MTTQLVPNKLVQKQLTKDEQVLINTIQSEISEGKERALDAVEHEKTKTYWAIGKHIKQHILLNKERANYGEYLFELLSEYIEVGKRVLYRTVQFYEAYPEIVSTSTQLSWSHYIAIMAVPEDKVRLDIEKQAIEQNLSVRDVKELIHNETSHSVNQEVRHILEVNRTAPYVYEYTNINNIDMVDLGFNFKIESPNTVNNATAVTKYGAVPHYTYKAYLVEVIDGDTVWVHVDLGMKGWTTQKLRFRGINSEGIETPAGITAKDYVVARLAGCKFIAIKTYWRDKYTRYLADIFYDSKETDLVKLIQNGKFLNQELLDAGYAVGYE